VELFSLEPWEFITIADIVERAGMTPATFYYHFSREQLLQEIVQDFAQKWIDMVERLLVAADTPEALNDVAGQLLDEIDEAGPAAKIFFLSTEKEPLLAERIRAEQRKHDGTLPLIGVNTFRNPAGTLAAPGELARATEEEKKSQLERVRDFTERHREDAHAALAALKETARSGGNVFAVLMDAARVCRLQQITEAFFEVGGQYRRNV
jgi:isobutyryl-CoA mutase